jgi:uncharacterized membrane protein
MRVIERHPKRMRTAHRSTLDSGVDRPPEAASPISEDHMSNLVAVAYPDEATASEVAQTLVELQKERSIELDDLVVAIRKDDGKIKLKQSFSPAGSGAAGGALWGGLIGLIFFMPLLGMAIGGATGAAAGKMTDVGVDDAFMKDLGEKLQPGGAAVFVLVRQSTPDKVLPRISQYGGDVIHSSLSSEAEETLQEALREHTTA